MTTCNLYAAIQKGLFAFFFFTTKNFCTTSAVYAICATVGCFFVSIWQNCNADAEKFCLQCLPCKREKPQISTQRQSCTQFVQPLGVFCVNLLKLQCRCAKILFAMFAVQERKTTNFTQRRRVRNLCNRWVFFVSIWQNCNADRKSVV